MRWKRRRCCCTLLSSSFCSCVWEGLWYWDNGRRPRVNPVTMTDRGVHILKPDSNSSSMKQSKWKYPGVPPIPPMFDVKLSSALDESSQQGLEISLGSNISLSGEIRAKRTLVVEPFKYILNEPEACMQSAPFLVLLIAVEPKQVGLKECHQADMGQRECGRGLGFVRLFLLGVKDDKGIGSKIQRTIEAESRQHHDIIQQDFQDTYQNLTLKTLMGMYWVATYCPSARYVMKTDSDMFVNTEYLIHKLLKPKEQPRQKYFTGYLMRGYAPNRNKRSKWYMSQELYPSERYPIFCSGTGYVFSGDMAHRIYGASLSIRRLHLEDVYVGICLAKLRIEPVPPPNEFLFNHWRVSYSSCKYSHLITSHQFHPNELLKYWQHLQSNKHNACINMPLKVKDKTSRKLL